ncbi:MAG TPA: PAS domain-containing sensor histidine kinase [Phycisphaerales bacterium]|nr:PAS domain-containing sensor histidine kinase [Phycisphaerales bacterium]
MPGKRAHPPGPPPRTPRTPGTVVVTTTPPSNSDRRPTEGARNASLGAAEIVHEQSARDRAALAAALDPIITIDARGTIQSASDSVQRVLSWTPAELIGQNVNVLMPEPHHSAHDGYLANYHRTGQTNIMNRPRRFDAMRKDGSLVPIELCVSRADVPGSGPPLFVGIIRDMSAFAAAERSRDEERVRSQQLLAEQTSALQQANTRLRMADRMASIGTLAAGLGHDMNNVLLPVRARLNALRSSGQAGNLSKGDSKHVEEIQKSVAYLQQLADGLHFLALDPDTEEDTRGGGGATDLKQWWSQAGALLSKAVPKHVRVTASFPDDLPHVAVAPHGLTQAVLNLVVNAGEAIPPPSERKRKQGSVRISAEHVRGDAGQWIHIVVSDNGTGMTEEIQRRAFEMFFTTKPRGLGTGLGLALVRKVIERAGGRIGIESEAGKGTTVVMIVPLARAETGDGAPQVSAFISLQDGRAAGLIRHLLESSGAHVLAQDADSTRIWVLDPVATDVEAARNWCRRRPNGRLVLFGRPTAKSAGSWAALHSIQIDAPEDLNAVRAALHAALSAQSS